MAQTIKLKRSATAGAAPTTSQLELGEVAINTFDGKMYIKKNVGGTESIVEISGSGGGSTAADAILEEYLYTATSSQTAFSGNDDNSAFLQYAPGAIQVFLNGVLLDPETDYTATNGLTVTLTSGAATDDYLQIFAFKKKIGDGNVSVDTFSGNNSTTAFTLSLDPGDENNTRVFIDGVYQSKSNYTVSGTTLTFSSAPPSGTGIEVEIGNRAVSLDTTTSLDLPDDVKLRFGTALDLEIYHDGSNSLINDNGTGSLKLQTGGSTKLEVTSTGVDVTGNIAVSGTVDGVDIAARDGVLTSTTTTAGAALPRTGGAMTGAITTNSTFDGRDVATDGAKLDGIESGATADQTQSEINALGITATGLSGTPAISVANITTTGELRGPASFVVDPAAVGDNTGTVIIKGNLQVDGATTTINSTTLTVDDLNLTLASGAANGTAANGAGITVDGASATITYNSTGDSWDFNKNINLGDNSKALFGDSSDLQIFHNGSGVNYIQSYTSGELRLESNGNTTIRTNNGEDMAVFTKNGAVTLYHNNIAKIATTSTGIDVTGSVTADGVQSTDGDIKVTTLGSFVGFNSQRAGVPSSGGYQLGRLNFDAYSTGTTFVSGTSIQSYSDGAAWTSSSTPAYLSFQTTPSGSTSLKERIKIAANGDISFYEDTGSNAKLFWDASEESLGIGTSSPATGTHSSYQNLVIGETTSATSGLSFKASTTGQSAIFFSDGASPFNRGQVLYDHSSDHLAFSSAGTEAMRINASGNLLIGKDDDDATTDGIQARGLGSISIARSSVAGDALLILNKKTNDGTIAEFRKDGATVGSIDTHSDVIQFGQGNVNLAFENATDTVYPVNDSGTNNNGDIDLGKSNARFKDLHLSGTANVGILSVNAGTGNIAATFESTDAGSYINIIDDSSGTFGAMIGAVGDDILFSPNNVERMRIDSSGNVGIGTGSDTLNGILNVKGGVNSIVAYSTTTTDQPGLFVGNNSAFNTSTNSLYAKIYGSGITASAMGATLGDYAVIATDGSDNNGLLIGSFNNAPIIFGTNNVERMRIDSSGKVRIGSGDPTFMLDVGPVGASGGDGIQISAVRNATLRFLGTDSSIQADEITGRLEWYTSDTNNAGVHAQILTRGTNTAGSGELQIWSGTAGSLAKNVIFRGDQTVFNEDGADMDFRVESSSSTHAFFVDAGNDKIVSQSTGGLEIQSGHAFNFQAITVQNTGTSTSSSHKAQIHFDVNGSNGMANRAKIIAGKTDSGSTNGFLRFDVQNSGTVETRLSLRPTEVVVNDESYDVDFRVESNGNANMLFVDGGNDGVAFGTNSVSAGVHTIRLDGTDVSGSTEGATVTSSAILNLANFNGTTTNNTVMLLGSTSANTVGQIASGIGFTRENSTNWGTQLRFYVHPTSTSDLDALDEVARFTTSEFVVNEQSMDYDFRVESDGNANALFVDASANVLYIGKNTGALADTGYYFNANTGNAEFCGDGSTDTLRINRKNSAGTVVNFWLDTVSKGTISVASTGTTYNTTSDRRLKDNIETITDGTDKLMAMNPVTHGWKDNPEADTVHGFIAQEMQGIVPEAVSGDPDSEEMMSMDYGRITPVIVAALQDAVKEIKELKIRINQLENR